MGVKTTRIKKRQIVILICMLVVVGIFCLFLIARQQAIRSQEAAEAGAMINAQNEELRNYKERIEDLRHALDYGYLTEEEAYYARKELYEISDAIYETHGVLINTVYSDLSDISEIIDRIIVENARWWLNKYGD